MMFGDRADEAEAKRIIALAVERWYDFPEIGSYLGNVD